MNTLDERHTQADASLLDRVSRACVHASVVAMPLAAAGGSIGFSALTPQLSDNALLRIVVLQVLVLVGLASWALSFSRGESGLRWTGLGWLAAGYTAWIAVSAAVSPRIALSLLGEHGRQNGLLTQLTMMALLFLVVQVIDSPRQIATLGRTVVATGATLALYGIVQAAGSDPVRWGTIAGFDQRMAFATFGNPDALGGYLLIPFGIALGMSLSGRGRREALFYGAAAALIAVGLTVTFVRGAWIGALVVTAFIVFAAVRTRVAPLKAVASWLAAGLIVVAVVGAASSFAESAERNAVQRVVSAFDTSSGSVGTRFFVWGSSASAVSSKWLVGEGPGAFVPAYARHENPDIFPLLGGLVLADDAHNMPLQAAVTTGVPGAALLIALLLGTMSVAARQLLRRGGGGGRIVATGFAAGFGGYCVYLLAGLQYPSGEALMWVVAGVLLSLSSSRVELGVRRRHAGVALSSVFIVLVIASAAFGGLRIMAESDYARAVSPSVSPPMSLELLGRATSRIPWEPVYQRALARAHLQSMPAQPGAVDPSVPTRHLTEGVSALQRAERLAPDDFRTSLTRAGLYLRAAEVLDPGYAAQARGAAMDVTRLRPVSPEGFALLAQAESLRGDPEAGITAARQGVRLWPGHVDSNVALALLLEEAGDSEAAVSQYRVLLGVLDPSDPRKASVQQAIEAYEALVPVSGTE